MNSKLNKLTGAAVLAAALATAGCNADMFNQANAALKSIQTAGKSVGNVRLPTAAIAASLGGMKLMETLSKDGKEAKSSGIIAAGGGNLVAAGSGNIIAAGGMNYLLTALTPGADETRDVKGDKIDGTVRYSSEGKANDKGVVTKWSSVITDFKCKSQGYDIAATGDFTFDAEGNKISCHMKGSISHGETKIDLTDLSFETVDPLPANVDKIGGFTLATKDGKDEYIFVATIGVKDSKIVAEAESKKNGVSSGEKVKFDETNAAAQAGADGADSANDVNKAK